MALKRVALLTAGGFAPCLSTAVGMLIERYTELEPEVEIIAYEHGYHGLLTGKYLQIDDDARAHASRLQLYGGSPIGNSRVKLTNTADLVKRGLIKEGEDALKVAADQLVKDGVDVLHTIGGDDTNTTAADLAAYLEAHKYHLTVVGLPKTIDNDVVPIRQSLGAYTAAENTSIFAQHIISESRVSPRMLIVHEVMGRNCGWLTAYSAKLYREWLDAQTFVPSVGLDRKHWDINGIYVPEMHMDIESEGKRLKKIMDENDTVNIFLSEGAGVMDIVAEMEAQNQVVNRDAFGHVRLDEINPGQYFAKRFAKALDAEKVLVQKSGYFARSAPSNQADLQLIKGMVDLGVQCAIAGESGVIGHDEENGNRLSCIDFQRIKGGKPFDVNLPWFRQMLQEIGQA
ncbi:pyrophosphate--fructose-6-phosphate 1-phosphotransferase [uncultured Mobiluncus sp.]|uniref:pyrophosphate--fructose-6-phosphate 1-phosphotransferase n=1 Tax=uncultured Mobiluncus sp. TaxID=293425 RepID=UPI0027D93B2E|nr:pyrophosphate--fructose-6-phosphate 1-phosphotransferase [uncultured Mobiluncus sp.]